MNKRDFGLSVSSTRFDRNDEKGSAIVIALFVLALLGVFVALAMTRTASEAAAVGNETAEGRTFYAAQGSLETMTRNFNKLFEVKLNPTETDRDAVRNGLVPGLADDFTFVQEVDRVSDSTTKVLNGDTFSGLYAIQDAWRLRTTATDTQGTQVELTRNILNNRIPIFQFGIFYEDDLELYRPPLFSFGGRVHTNRHFFISPGGENVYFDSRVTAVGHIVTESWRNGYSGDNYNGTYIKDASGTFRQLPKNSGSVLNGTPNVLTELSDYPSSRLNPNWNTVKATFDGNLQNDVTELKLPLKVGTEAGDETKLIEMIKRGKEVGKDLASDTSVPSSGTPVIAPVTAPVAGNPPTSLTADNAIMRSERFANKPGIRISLSDSKAKLPGCASGSGITPVSGQCGVRLDGHRDGLGGGPLTVAAATTAGNLGLAARGYDPMLRPMTDGYRATRVNGERLNGGYNTKEVWIKVELVSINETDDSIITADVTQEFLSLGVTEEAPLNFTISGYNNGLTRASSLNGTFAFPSANLTNSAPQTMRPTYPDSRSIIKLQRFMIPGSEIGVFDANRYLNYVNNSNVVVRYRTVNTDALAASGCQTTCTAPAATTSVDPNNATFATERYGHLKRATIGTENNLGIVPFPIKMYDDREGLYFDQVNTSSYPNANFGAGATNYRKVSRNGDMSMIDIDVANLRRFLRGDFNGYFPSGTPFATSAGTTLSSAHVSENGGWVLYVSDRRGDYDFDGEFDMEDIYGQASGTTPGNDGILQSGEDVNFNGVLDSRYCNAGATLNCESERYRQATVTPDLAAVNDHKYYRRGVRLVNGSVLPGIYDAGTASNTKGFTVASENGVYVKGNYNATGLSVTPPSNANSPYNNYMPFDTATHIPASIVADGITILSNAWVDAQSFSTPTSATTAAAYAASTTRTATHTQIRFAMISGDTIASRTDTPNQGSTASGERTNGGVHNFKRFLETWTGQRLDYSGSLINLFNSRNNNGAFKCCGSVYNPPRRNWVFDSTFLDPGRLPPGTPYFQYVQTTGFFRSND